MKSKNLGIGIAVIAVIAIAGLFLGMTGFLSLSQGENSGNLVTRNTFTETSNEIETINGKPVIRLFSTTWCPHCVWIKGTFDSVAKEYVERGEIVAYHWELDTGDNTLTQEIETEIPESETNVFKAFNPRNSIPTFVFGGKYFRIGNGYESTGSLALEEKEFKELIEKLIEEAK